VRQLRLATGLAIGLLLLAVGASPVTATPVQPNVVVILTDDEPALDGRLLDYMPNAKAIWKDNGVRFTNFHIESPLCCPGRAGFLTGQHTWNHGVTKNDVAMFNPAMTLATQLHAVGYYTMLAGKYFNQYEKIAPTVPPGWDRFTAFGTSTASDNYYNYPLYNDGDPTPEQHGSLASDYSTDVIAAKAISQIQSAPADKPIFAWITPTAPHAPNTPAQRYSNLACPIPAWRPANYNEADVSDKPAYVQSKPLLTGRKASSYDLTISCRTMRAVDDLVGSVRDALSSTGRLENTIFIYTSDNGFHVGEHRLVDKLYPYVTDVPFYVSWPAGLSAVPRTVLGRVENIDFAPTICAIAGCTLGPYPNGQTTPDGISFTDVLYGTSSTLDRDAVIETLNAPPLWYSITTTGPDKVVPGGPWHYIETSASSGITQELYDISGGPCYAWQPGQPGDPCELQNLLADPTWAQDPSHAAILSGLQARLARLKKEKGQGPGITLAKTADRQTYSSVGEQITYTYTLTNTGQTTLAGPFTVTDDRQGTISPCGSGPLDPGASTSCTSLYSVTQADYDGGSLTNTASATDGTVTSNSSTVTLTAKKVATITLTKSLAPSTDPGRFDLRVGTTTLKAAAGNDDSGSTQVAAGTYTVREVASSGTSLSNYSSSISCSLNGGPGPSAGSTSLSVTVAANDVLSCTITNARRATLTLAKSLSPSTDAGRFDLKYASTTVKSSAGDGDSGTKLIAPGTYTIKEQATSGTGTSLTNYVSTISCTLNGGTGPAGTGTSLSVTLAPADVLSCTFTNTRK
jgi:N-acetylglucosamine-6-sulfatase